MATDLIVGTVPAERAGMASGISETSAEFGGALGIAVLGSLVTAIYRNSMASTVPPDVPAAAADVARETLGGAVVMAPDLPGQTGGALLEAARAAFTEGVFFTAAVSAALAVVGAIVTATLLRRVSASQSAG
jgi:DHA2 family multidrug resistance protein-like MFS transporter